MKKTCRSFAERKAITFNLRANCLSKLLQLCLLLIVSSLIRDESSYTSISAVNNDETRRTRITPLERRISLFVFVYH